MPLDISALAALVGEQYVQSPTDPLSNALGNWYPRAVKQKQAEASFTNLLATVSPANAAEVAAVVRWAAAQPEPVRIILVGGDSNTVGSTLPEEDRPTIALNLRRLDTVSWDEAALSVTAGAGIVLIDLEENLNRHGYTLGSLPHSARIATVGGAVAAEMFGTFSAGYGGTRDNVIALEAVLASGTQEHTHTASGATRSLHHLLIGSEGKYGIVTAATLVMRPVPDVRAWCVFTFGKFADAVDALRLVFRSDARPACVRLLDASATRERFANDVSAGNCLLILGVEGTEIVQTGQYQTLFAICKQVGGMESTVDGDTWFEADRFRTDTFAANGRPGSLSDVLSVYAPWSALNDTYTAITAALRPDCAQLSAHITYADANGAALDIRFTLETNSPTDAIARYDRVLIAAQEAGITSGAYIGHHYGIGKSRQTWANAERGDTQTAVLQALKAAIDPHNIF